MNSISLLTSVLLLAGCSVISISSIPFEKSREGIVKRDSSQSQVIVTLLNEKATKCEKNGKDLNDDCWLQIFEGLDYPKLLDMAQVSKTFAYYANDVFRRTFADHEFVIFHMPQYPYEVDPGQIRISEFRLILQTLKHFGRFIRKLRLELIDDNSEHLKIIYKYIEDYCTDSLTDLNMKNLDILKYVKKPFTRVERIRIQNYKVELQSNQPFLNETFPALREFPLTFHTNNIEPFNCYFPHLEHVSVHSLFGSRSAEKFLLMNSHIKEAEIDMFFPWEFFYKYPSLLPNVDNLTVYAVYDHLNNEEIRFENVTRLSAMHWFNPTTHIFFPKLQELNMTWNMDVADWSVFFKNHPHLRRLNLTYWNRNDEEFNELSKHLLNLEELTITKVDYPIQYSNRIPEESIRIEAFIAFVTNNDKLQLLSLNGYTEDDKEILQKKLELEWTIDYKDNRIVLQRNKIQYS